MRRILTVALLSLLYVSLQAQEISFDALKKGTIDVSEIKKELILNGFTKVSKSSDSYEDTYAYKYDEDKETATIWVEVGSVAKTENAEIYAISILSFGSYIHNQLVDEIVELGTFDRIGEDDELIYTYEYCEFSVRSEDGDNIILVFPMIGLLPWEQSVKEELVEAMVLGGLERMKKAEEEEQ
jgi:hypothetical protein